MFNRVDKIISFKKTTRNYTSDPLTFPNLHLRLHNFWISFKSFNISLSEAKKITNLQ